MLDITIIVISVKSEKYHTMNNCEFPQKTKNPHHYYIFSNSLCCNTSQQGKSYSVKKKKNQQTNFAGRHFLLTQHPISQIFSH